ncbi:DNA cytosine methyltransferase [Rasiella sp. SM2506]|uniref:DNA cytosine methyltransferase n=1 Tax=Rasiella sp. SM2506 TaxID=3423914 RepID=UPI003D7A251F
MEYFQVICLSCDEFNNLKLMAIFQLGELFCGPGGLGLAATQSNINNPNFRIEHAWATDYDRDTCETYRQNIAEEENTVVCADIRKLDFNKLMKLSQANALSFGFPCNDFSIVGEQKGMDGVYGPLYSYCVKAVRKFKPQWFLAENVGGLKNSNDGNAFGKILNEFHNEGYSVYPHLYKFEKYGIPQARHRIIIIGIRNDINVTFKVPSPEIYSEIDNTSRNAIENPPITDNAFNHVYTNQSETVKQRLSYIKPGENAFTADIPKHLQLNVKGAKISQIYKRLDPNKPSYTVTGSGGGGTHVYHWEENRALTNRERARLQTFPDNFKFYGTKESIRKQIGMAVPARGAQIIFEAVLKSFAGIEYPSIPTSFTSLISQKHLTQYNLEEKFGINRLFEETAQ